MGYFQGGEVAASDYNAIVALFNEVFGIGLGDFGYSGESVNTTGSGDLPDVTANVDTVTSAQWLNLRNAIQDCADHQGTTLPEALPAITLLEVGDIITFFDALDSIPNKHILEDNRLVHDPVNMTSAADKAVSTRGTSWDTALRHEFTVTFSSTDAARHFFNTGGEIQFTASRTGGAVNSQNTDWSNLTADNTPYLFDAAAYYSLLSDDFFQVLRTVTGSGAYGSNDWTISGKRDDTAGPRGANGSILRFRSDFNDDHTNPFFDTVDGTFTSAIDELRSTAIFDNIDSPIYANVVLLTAGS